MKKINFIDCLKQKGLKNTKCRVLVLDILEQSNQPISVEKIYFYLSKRGLMVSISTVYRTLETLVEKNLITKLNLIGEDKAFFEYKRIEHKHYLICLSCKKMQAFENCPLGNYEEFLQKETNYDISGHKLDIYGYCPKCKKIKNA